MLKILTLTWNAEEKLKKLSKSLEYNLGGIEYEWHVRDNSSKDDSVNFLKSLKNTVVYEMSHNRDNFSKGMNFLIKESSVSSSDNVLLLNNDVVFNSYNSISDMLLLKDKTKSDVIGARLKYTDTNKLQHAGVIFSNKYGQMPYHFRHKEESDSVAETSRYFQAVTAAVSIVSGSALLEVQGFDEAFNWAFDDIDLFLRIGSLKKNNIAYCGCTDIFHEESASLKKNSLNKLFLNSNVQLFKKKWFGKYEIDHDNYLNNKNYNAIK